MSINIEKLDNVKCRGNRVIARCPACEEQGHDNKGNHLSVDDKGRFSCVAYPASTGNEHRKRIFALVGVKDGGGKPSVLPYNKVIKVKKIKQISKDIIKTNVMGRLGRVNQTHARKEFFDSNIYISLRDFEKGVPSVQNIEKELKQASNEIRLEFLQKKITEVNFNEDDNNCIRCNNPGERFCYGEDKFGEYKFGDFCLECRPF